MENVTTNEILVELRAFRKSTEARFDTMDQRFDAMDQRFDKMDQRFDSLESKVDRIDECLDEVAVYAMKTHGIVERLESNHLNHEVRISTLERSNARLRLLADR